MPSAASSTDIDDAKMHAAQEMAVQLETAHTGDNARICIGIIRDGLAPLIHDTDCLEALSGMVGPRFARREVWNI
jgi:hypothetical protein